MKKSREKVPLERGALSDLWRHTLSQIPSLFGQIAYLASLRDQNTGRYHHHGLAMVFGDEEAHRALRRSHENTFATWLGYSLEQQRTDLSLYLSGLPGGRRNILETWFQLKPFRGYVPLTLRSEEQALFISDFETLLAMLRGAGAAA